MTFRIDTTLPRVMDPDRDPAVPDAIAVHVNPDTEPGVVSLTADIAVPVISPVRLTPDEATAIGKWLIEAASIARAAQPVLCDCGCGKTRDVVRSEIMQARR